MAKRIDRASRLIHASAPKIYEAFSTAAAMENWLPPEGMTGTMLAFDFREGGMYRMLLSYNGVGHVAGKTTERADEVTVRFVKLIPGRRIEQSITFNTANTAFAGEMHITWIFDEAVQGTEVIVFCEDVPEGIRPEDHEAGLASTLRNLAAFTEGVR